MASKEEITEAIKARFATVKERGRVLAQALRARADIAASRRRLRAAFADLGEEIYERMASEEGGPLNGDVTLADYRMRIEGVKAELRQREKALQEIIAGDEDLEEAVEVEPEKDEDEDEDEEKA